MQLALEGFDSLSRPPPGSAPVHGYQNQGQIRSHPVILLQHDLIALKLAAHPKHLHLQLVDDLRILVIVLLELLQGELLLGGPLALGLLALFPAAWAARAPARCPADSGGEHRASGR